MNKDLSKLKMTYGLLPTVDMQMQYLNMHPELRSTIGIFSNIKNLNKEGLTTKGKDPTPGQWTQEDERLHPRGEGGKWTNKPGESETVSEPEKSKTWGGKREFSGRPSTDPAKMSIRLKDKFKLQNPDWSDDQVNEAVKQYAKDNLKPDLLQYMENPDEYYKKVDEDRKNALLESYKTTAKKVKPVSDSADTKEVLNDIRTSVNKWNEEVQKSKDIVEAAKTFRSKEADSTEVLKARTILGIAAFTTALGLVATLMAKKTPRGLFPTLLSGIRDLSPSGRPDITKVVPNTLLRVLNIVSPKRLEPLKPGFEIYSNEIGSARKLISSILRKINYKGKPLLNKKQIIDFGPPIYGYKGKYGLGKGYSFNVNGNYVPEALDADKITNLVIVGKDGIPDLVNIAISKKKLPHLTKNTTKFLSDEAKDNLKKEWGLEAIRKKRTYHIVNEDAFYKKGESVGLWDLPSSEEIALQKTSPKKGKYLVGNKVLLDWKKSFPSEMYRLNWESTDINSYNDIVSNRAAYWNEKIIPMISRRVLSYLTAVGTVGTTTALFFEKDIEQSVSDIINMTKSDYENNQRAMMEQAKAQESESKKKESRLDKEIKLETARGKRNKAEAYKETLRKATIDMLVHGGLRDRLEGATTEKTLTNPIILQRYAKRVMQAMDGWDTEDKVNKFVNEMENDEEKRKAFMRIVAMYFNEEARKEKNSEELLNEFRKFREERKTEPEKKSESKSAELFDLVIKGFSDNDSEYNEMRDYIENEPEFAYNLKMNLIAHDVASMISDISQGCKEVVKNGMPGHSDFEQINDFLVDFYKYLKDKSKENIDEESDNEIYTKSFDSVSGLPYLSSQSDQSAGLFVGEKHKPNEKCPKCEKIVNEEVISKCNKVECPFSHLDSIETKE